MSVENSAETTDVEQLTNENLGRRAFSAGIGTMLATAVMGSAAADDDQGDQVEVGSTLNFDSPFAHESELRATFTISETDLGSGWTETTFEADDGTESDLGNDGWEVAPRSRDHSEDDPEAHNPVRIALDKVEHDQLWSAPRDVYDDEDEEDPVSFLSADAWTGDDIVSGPEYDSELVVDGTGSVSWSHADWDGIDSSELSRMVSLVFNVELLEEGDKLTLEVDHSGADPVEFVIDPEANEDDDDVLAVSEGYGKLAQSQVGDVSSDVEEISGLTITTEGDPTVEIHGLDLEGSTAWEFGERELVELDDDDEEELNTITVDSWDGGPVGITSLSSIEGTFSTAVIGDVEVDLRQRARDLGTAERYVRTVESPVGFDYEWRSTAIFEHEVTSAFELEVDVSELRITGGLPDRRYEEVGYDVGSGTFSEDEDVEDILDELSTIGVSEDLEAGEDDPAEIVLSEVGEGETVTFVADVLLNPDELEELEETGVFAVGATGDDSSGWFSGPRAVIMTIAALVGAWVGRARGVFSS